MLSGESKDALKLCKSNLLTTACCYQIMIMRCSVTLINNLDYVEQSDLSRKTSSCNTKDDNDVLFFQAKMMENSQAWLGASSSSIASK